MCVGKDCLLWARGIDCGRNWGGNDADATKFFGVGGGGGGFGSGGARDAGKREPSGRRGQRCGKWKRCRAEQRGCGCWFCGESVVLGGGLHALRQKPEF